MHYCDCFIYAKSNWVLKHKHIKRIPGKRQCLKVQFCFHKNPEIKRNHILLDHILNRFSQAVCLICTWISKFQILPSEFSSYWWFFIRCYFSLGIAKKNMFSEMVQVIAVLPDGLPTQETSKKRGSALWWTWESRILVFGTATNVLFQLGPATSFQFLLCLSWLFIF